MKRTETQRVNAWSKTNTKGFYIKLNKEKDSDIIEILDAMTNKQGMIKELIRVNAGNLDEYGVFERYVKKDIRADILAENSMD